MNVDELRSLPDLDFAKGPGLAPGHDAFLLARWVDLVPGELILDMGTGQGIIALMLAAREEVRVVGLDRDPSVLQVARENFLRNRLLLKGQVHWLLGDLRHLPWNVERPNFVGFDHVVMNPPYRVPAKGRLPRDPHRAAARFELHGSLSDWATAAAASLRPGGKISCIHLPERAKEAVQTFRDAGFGSIRVTQIADRKNLSAPWILLDAQKLSIAKD